MNTILMKNRKILIDLSLNQNKIKTILKVNIMMIKKVLKMIKKTKKAKILIIVNKAKINKNNYLTQNRNKTRDHKTVVLAEN